MQRKYTTLDIKEAIRWAKERVFKLRIDTDYMEAVNESFENGVFVFAKMNYFLHNEMRRDKVCLPDTKVCTLCNQVKAGMEFYHRTDYRTNFTYHIQPCKTCHEKKYRNKKLTINNQ